MIIHGKEYGLQRGTPMSHLRRQLEQYTLAYVTTCEKDYTEAQRRLDRAIRIRDYVASGKPMGDSPTPILNEIAEIANRFAARVDALIMAVYTAEEGSGEPYENG